MERNGMRIMREPVYVDRRAQHIAYGRRQAVLVMVIGLVIFGLMLGGIGLVSSRGASTPTPVGAHKAAATAQLEKWVRRFVVRSGGQMKGLVVECRGVRCAAYTPDAQTEVAIVRMANYRYHVLKLVVPDVVPVGVS